MTRTRTGQTRSKTGKGSGVTGFHARVHRVFSHRPGFLKPPGFSSHRPGLWHLPGSAHRQLSHFSGLISGGGGAYIVAYWPSSASAFSSALFRFNSFPPDLMSFMTFSSVINPFRSQDPRHKCARMLAPLSRFREKGRICLPCEKMRSTAVEVARLLSANDKQSRCVLTWHTEVIQGHAR